MRVKEAVMARIRSIKPDFFRHEVLQDLEIEHPGMSVMLVFAAIWGHCDSKGRFPWRPRQLKLDILPFLPFDMAETLSILEGAGMVNRYEVDGKEYGEIPSFVRHQRITGKEAKDGEKYPPNPGVTSGKHLGNNVERPDAQEKERGKRKEEREKTFSRGTEGKSVKQQGNIGEEQNLSTGDKSPVDAELPVVETDLQRACKATWAAYSQAYVSRYGTEPVRNAKVNSAVKGFVQRIGYEKSPHIAGWFVSHPDAFYNRRMHDFGLLLKDAEKLHTEWATGRRMTQTKASQTDKTASNFDNANSALEILAAKGLT